MIAKGVSPPAGQKCATSLPLQNEGATNQPRPRLFISLHFPARVTEFDSPSLNTQNRNLLWQSSIFMIEGQLD